MPQINPDDWQIETKQVHIGFRKDSTTNAYELPIYQTSSFNFNNTDHAEALFNLSETGNIYTRMNNPTENAIETRIAALEGGAAALLVASGQTAETLAILNLANTGDHIVSSYDLYGGTFNLFKHTLNKLGISTTFITDPDDLNAWEAAIQPNTKAFYGETVGNPKVSILDIPNIATIAHKHGIPLIVDNTLPSPYLLRPFEHGADIVVHSATKYLSGHGNLIAGVIVESGKFDWAQGKFPGFTTPDESYHGLIYKELAPAAYTTKARLQLLRDFGPAISPFNAYLLGMGIETLSLRMERQVENAIKVAEYLETKTEVIKVNYAGLKSSPWYERAQKLTPKGVGAVLSFELKGDTNTAKKFIDALELHYLVANIGDVKSLVIHPATTTHQQLTPSQQQATGVTPNLVRLSVGIENIIDIIADLELGFKAIT